MKLTLLLLLSTSTAFSQVKYAICYHNTPACKCSTGEAVARDTAFHRTTDTIPPYCNTAGVTLITYRPDTVRAIILATMCRNCAAEAIQGYVVIQQGKRLVYLDCRKRALRGSQVGWGYEIVNTNYKR